MDQIFQIFDNDFKQLFEKNTKTINADLQTAIEISNKECILKNIKEMFNAYQTYVIITIFIQHYKHPFEKPYFIEDKFKCAELMNEAKIGDSLRKLYAYLMNIYDTTFKIHMVKKLFKLDLLKKDIKLNNLLKKYTQKSLTDTFKLYRSITNKDFNINNIQDIICIDIPNPYLIDVLNSSTIFIDDPYYNLYDKQMNSYLVSLDLYYYNRDTVKSLGKYLTSYYAFNYLFTIKNFHITPIPYNNIEIYYPDAMEIDYDKSYQFKFAGTITQQLIPNCKAVVQKVYFIIDKDIFILVKDRIKNNEIIVINISLQFSDNFGHANILIYNPYHKEVEIFDPQDPSKIDFIIKRELFDTLFGEFPEIVYIPQNNYIETSFQTFQENASHNEIYGQCVAWTLYYAYKRLQLMHLNAVEAYNTILRNVFKNNKNLSTMIEGFVNYISKKIEKLDSDKKYTYTVSYENNSDDDDNVDIIIYQPKLNDRLSLNSRREVKKYLSSLKPLKIRK
jgi:hypothetical protein